MSDQETSRQMLPEVEKYIAALEAAEAAYSKVERDARKEYPNRNSYGEEAREQRTAYYRVMDAARGEFNTARREAWGTHIKGSADPLVRWIAEHCREYWDQAVMVLKALPATPDELDALADEHDWCSAWYELRDQAEEAGVLPGGTPVSKSRRALKRWLRDEYGIGRRGVAKVSELVDAILAEEGEKSAA